MQINREEVYTIELCEHMLSLLRIIVHHFLYIQDYCSDEAEPDSFKEVIEFAHAFMISTDPDNID